jgi:hypothetical protein
MLTAGSSGRGRPEDAEGLRELGEVPDRSPERLGAGGTGSARAPEEYKMPGLSHGATKSRSGRRGGAGVLDVRGYANREIGVPGLGGEASV